MWPARYPETEACTHSQESMYNNNYWISTHSQESIEPFVLKATIGQWIDEFPNRDTPCRVIVLLLDSFKMKYEAAAFYAIIQWEDSISSIINLSTIKFSRKEVGKYKEGEVWSWS